MERLRNNSWAKGLKPLALPLLVATALLAVACSGEANPTPSPELKVITTNGILADLAGNVGGEGVEVTSIAPPGADLHSFQPTPGDSQVVRDARVIISNGHGLDDALGPMIRSAMNPTALQVVASDGLEAKLVEVIELDQYGDEADADYLEGDPHFWQNPQYAIHYVERIRDGLSQADPANASLYRSNAEAYIQRLRDLDREIMETLNTVPPERRHLVTFHDAFGYFARRYGWRLSAFVAHDASDITPQAVADIMQRVEEERITAIFTEPQFSAGVLSQLARDVSVEVGTIYSDALDATTPTYIEMMRFNARSLAEHLGR